MSRFAAYVGSPGGFRAARGDAMTYVTGLPAWARTVLFILAIPGICLIVLSAAALVASIATLLLLTVPAYALLRRICDAFGRKRAQRGDDEPPTPTVVSRPARRVEATVIS